MSNVTAIAAGGGHSMALRSDGSVVCWGWNRDGQTNVPAGLAGVVTIAAGGSEDIGHSLDLLNNGTVVVWGNGEFGGRMYCREKLFPPGHYRAATPNGQTVIEPGGKIRVTDGCRFVRHDSLAPKAAAWPEGAAVTAAPDNPKPIMIGRGVFIGARALVLKGVTIGDRAVIGAGAVVTKDVPPLHIAVGNPARVLSAKI